MLEFSDKTLISVRIKPGNRLVGVRHDFDFFRGFVEPLEKAYNQRPLKRQDFRSLSHKTTFGLLRGILKISFAILLDKQKQESL